jgi:hypothetical protein
MNSQVTTKDDNMNAKLPWKDSSALENHCSNDSYRDWSTKFELLEKTTGNTDAVMIPPHPHVRYRRRNSATARMLLQSLSNPVTNSLIHSTDNEPANRNPFSILDTVQREGTKDLKMVTERSERESTATSQISLTKNSTVTRMKKRGSLPWSQRYRDSLVESGKLDEPRSGKRQKKE